MNKKLDIIIPAFNAHSTIIKTLSSIAMQTIVDECQIIIVDDFSNESYDDICAMFSNLINVKLVKLGQNYGPGVARQIGMQNSDSPFITFIDADDTFSNAFTLESLLKQFDTFPNSIMLISTFYEELEDGQFAIHDYDSVWMFGKIYKREFLEENNIKFNNTRANEDNGFNSLIRLCVANDPKVIYTKEVSYHWHYKKDSITRKDNGIYSFTDSFPGYLTNMVYALQGAEERQTDKDFLIDFLINVMCYCYVYYIRMLNKAPQLSAYHLNYIKTFYNLMYSKYESKIKSAQLAKVYSDTIETNSQMLEGIIPEIAFYDFMDLIKK